MPIFVVINRRETWRSLEVVYGVQKERLFLPIIEPVAQDIEGLATGSFCIFGRQEFFCDEKHPLNQMLCHGGATKSNAVNERVDRPRVWYTTGVEPKARSIAKNPHQIICASVGFRGARPIPVLRGDDRQCPQ